MDTVIKIEKLYKEYRLGVIGHGTLREDLSSWWARLNGKPDPNSIIGIENKNNIDSQRILALNNINIKIKKGERLGIIGPNGAGKTTLLKILSRISSPTLGSVQIKGKVASLIAVGTGFHPELTGRENIFLNGTILGLRNYEISQRFDEIIDFAGVENFIDTPIKRYSSGMKIRLGFSVAAHLDPDILMVDEVLAVGDAEFKRKAIKKMEDNSNQIDRTILFVSHDLGSIRRLCTKCLLISDGQIIMSGNPEETINYYLRDKEMMISSQWINSNNIHRDIFLKRAELIDANNKKKDSFITTEKIGIRFEIILKKSEPIIIPAINLSDGLGNLVLNAIDFNDYWKKNKDPGKYISTVWIPENLLGEKTFYISIALVSPTHQGKTKKFFNEKEILSFCVFESSEDSSKGQLVNVDWSRTLISPKLDWEVSYSK